MIEKKNITINPVAMVAIVIQLLFVVAAAVSINQILEPKQPKLEVNLNGLNQAVPGLPEDEKDSIGFYIFQAISNNNPGSNILKNGINVRENSTINKYYENADMYYASFIVDIPDIEQSYRVSQVWAGGDDNQYISPNINTAVVCLDEDEMIYPDFNCRNDNMYSAQTVLASVLRAVRTQFEKDGSVTMSLEYYGDYGDSRIRISRWECETLCFCRKLTEEGKNQVVEEFREFLEDLGYKLSQVPYYVYNCENEERIINEDDEVVLQEVVLSE